MIVNLIELKNILGEKNLAVVIRCILDRIPILVYSNNDTFTNSLINAFASLAQYRVRLVFRKDFTTIDEYIHILETENADYNIDRIIVESPCESTAHLDDAFGSLNGWIIGVPNTDNGHVKIQEKITSSNPRCLMVSIEDTKRNASLNLLGAEKIDTSFEENLLNRIFRETDIALEKIKRVVNKKVGKSPLSEVFIKSILDFASEREYIAFNMFKSEIGRFIDGARRAFSLLSRIKLLEEIGLNISISEKTLLDAIQYKNAPARRLLDFINAEWGVNLNACISKGVISSLGDLVEGLWG
ncbi:MAG: hypothetical protein ACTSSJ_03215 [Candidatus Odinarchaeia archaeon]